MGAIVSAEVSELHVQLNRWQGMRSAARSSNDPDGLYQADDQIDALESELEEIRDVAMIEQARALAARCLAVFPIFTIEDSQCSCGDADCASPGKHPIGSLVPQGHQNASSDPQAIREWWAVYPDANIGIATGDASGIVVVDIDPDDGGERTLHNLEQRFGQLPETWCALTGGDGYHFLFKMPRLDIRNSAGTIGPGIDIRGNGGYIVAPPSLHESGKRYEWSPILHPDRVELVDVPSWLLERMVTRRPDPASSDRPKTLPATIPKGERNSWMASIAGTMRRKGFCAEAIYAAIAIENERRCDPPMDDREVRKIADSIERYAPETVLRAGGASTLIPFPTGFRPVRGGGRRGG